MRTVKKLAVSKYSVLVLFLILFLILILAVNFTKQPKVTIPAKTETVKHIELVRNNQENHAENIKIKVEIAKRESELTKGLSGRQNLEKNSGMLFELSEKKTVTFWMKDMNFPLDIIWIDENIIIGIEKNAPRPTGDKIPTFSSPKPVNFVLEVNAGFSEKNNINIGDKVIAAN